MIFEIFRDKQKQFRFRLKALNGRVIAQSEGYHRKASIKKLQHILWRGEMKVKDLTI